MQNLARTIDHPATACAQVRLPVRPTNPSTQNPASGPQTALSQVEVMITHDATPEAADAAHEYARLLSLSPLMLAVLREATDVWQDDFDGPPNTDLNVSGQELIAWFTDWRLRARSALP